MKTKPRKTNFKKTGDLVKRLRIKRGLSQRTLAMALGYKDIAQNVSNIERGKSGIPRQKVSLLAKCLGVSKNKIANAILRQERERLS